MGNGGVASANVDAPGADRRVLADSYLGVPTGSRVGLASVRTKPGAKAV